MHRTINITGEESTVDEPISTQQPGIAFIMKPDNVTLEVGARNIMQQCIADDSFAEITWHKDGQELPSGKWWNKFYTKI